jgi:hypothetical protein
LKRIGCSAIRSAGIRRLADVFSQTKRESFGECRRTAKITAPPSGCTCAATSANFIRKRLGKRQPSLDDGLSAGGLAALGFSA